MSKSDGGYVRRFVPGLPGVDDSKSEKVASDEKAKARVARGEQVVKEKYRMLLPPFGSHKTLAKRMGHPQDLGGPPAATRRVGE